MNLIRISLLALAVLAGCSKSPKVQTRLEGDYEMSGGPRSATFFGSYTISKNGVKVGELNLAKDRIEFFSFAPDGSIAGQLQTPVVQPTEAGSSATIWVTNSDGLKEGHQLIESKIFGGVLNPELKILKGSVIHGGPYLESNKSP